MELPVQEVKLQAIKAVQDCCPTCKRKIADIESIFERSMNGKRQLVSIVDNAVDFDLHNNKAKGDTDAVEIIEVKADDELGGKEQQQTPTVKTTTKTTTKVIHLDTKLLTCVKPKDVQHSKDVTSFVGEGVSGVLGGTTMVFYKLTTNIMDNLKHKGSLRLSTIVEDDLPEAERMYFQIKVKCSRCHDAITDQIYVCNAEKHVFCESCSTTCKKCNSIKIKKQLFYVSNNRMYEFYCKN